MREAGLLSSLRREGATVVNLSDLSLFPFGDDPEHPRQRNAGVVACAVRAASDEMTRALAEGFPLVLGGDCSLVAGTLAGGQKALNQPVGLIYLDANADLNTPETTPSGRLSGMALALALGRGPEEVVAAGGPPPAVLPEHVTLLGFRELDPGERAAIGELSLALPSAAVRRLGIKVAAALALDGVENEDGPVLVHMDVDVIDPKEMAATDRLTPGPGLSLEEVSDLLTALVASPRVVALEVTGFHPEEDPQGVYARRVVDLVTRAMARRLRIVERVG